MYLNKKNWTIIDKIQIRSMILLSEWMITALISFKLVVVIEFAHVNLSRPRSPWPGFSPFAEFL
jgi:hypothetical protein